MPTAITAIFGADSTQFQMEMRRIELLSGTAGRNLGARFSEGSHMGFARVIQEMAVIGREIAMGRGTGRILGSSALLYQFLRNLVSHSKDASSAARMVSDAYAEMSLTAAQNAKEMLRKAQASELAFYADAEETEATLNAAIADRAKAQSSEQAALATRQKAIASENAAVAAEAEAAATGASSMATTILTVGLAAAALTAGFLYEKLKGIKDVMDSLTPGSTDTGDDYIPLMKRHINDAKNAQKQVTDEVQKTVDAYHSAAEANKQITEETKSHYEHQKKILELQKNTELDGAKTAAEKEAIEKKYADRAMQLQKDQQHEELVNLNMAQLRLNLASKEQLRKANGITVTTKEEDQSMLSKLDKQASYAQKFLEGGGVWSEFKKQAAIQLGGADAGLIEGLENGGTEQANKMIQERNKFSDKVAANDETRKQKKQLVDDAAKAAADAAKIGLQLPDQAKKNAKDNADYQEELNAQLAEEKAKDEAAEDKKSPAGGFALNSQQRIGAYASTPPDWSVLLLNVKGIHENTKHLQPNPNAPPGSRPPQFGPRAHK